MHTTLASAGDRQDDRAQPLPSRRDTNRAVIAAALATGIEMFDFTVYGFFAAMIGEAFFPAKDPLTSLLLAVGTFGVGFLMRPLGALLLGAYADRVGRRAAMVRGCWLMSLGTAALALCPSFASIGMAAPLIVVAGRCLQGFAVGGEIGTAASYVMESARVSRRAFLLSWQLTSLGAAALLGASLGLLLSHTLSSAALAAWGWRVPFLLGLLIAPLGLYLRSRLPEHRPGVASVTAEQVRTPLTELWQDHGRKLFLAVLMVMGQTVPVYATVYFMPSYMTRVLHMSALTGFLVSASSAALLTFVPPLAGLVIDRLPRRKPLSVLCSAGMALAIYPVFLLITQAKSAWPIICGAGVISLLLAIGTGSTNLRILEALPARVRASGMALAYALDVAIFGGTAQFIVTGLIKWTGDPMSATWYVAPACVVSFAAQLLFRERKESRV